MTAAEVWTDVPHWEGRYQVSTLGRVRSVDRTVVDRSGRPRRYRGKLLVLSAHTRRGLDRVVTLSDQPNDRRQVFCPARFLRRLAAGEAAQ